MAGGVEKEDSGEEREKRRLVAGKRRKEILFIFLLEFFLVLQQCNVISDWRDKLHTRSQELNGKIAITGKNFLF